MRRSEMPAERMRSEPAGASRVSRRAVSRLMPLGEEGAVKRFLPHLGSGLEAVAG